MKRDKSNRPGYGKILDAWVAPEDSGEPVGCVATTFTFSPALFEEECLSRFLRLETDATEDGPAYVVEREEKLSQLSCAAVLVDQHYARGVRSLRWDLLPARLARGGGILHAKVSLLLWRRHARLIVGSANLTEDGYRRNHEVFAVLDYFEDGDTPLAPLHDIVGFLRDAVGFVDPAGKGSNHVVARWLAFIDKVSTTTRAWGARESPRKVSKPRVVAVLTGSKRISLFESIRKQFPDANKAERAYVISPFFDPPDAPNVPALQIWNVLKQRGAASVEYHVTAEEVPGEDAVFIHAPKSLEDAQPTNREQVTTAFYGLKLEDGRPLHAKCLWFENDRLILHLIGSSNFTSAGLGLGKVKNLEANLAFIVSQQDRDAKKALENAWLEVEDISIRDWKPRPDEGVDFAPDVVLLPVEFSNATFGCDSAQGGYVEFSFAGEPPSDWTLFPEDSPAAFANEMQWRQQGSPAAWRIPWPNSRPPSGFQVSWRESGGFAWWPVNILDSAALPPPDVLKNLPLEVLIEILTSSKPLHSVLAHGPKRSRTVDTASEISLDPHKRVDTSSFLLHRTRRVSRALLALRRRLELPVVTEQALAWKLRGPVGVLAFAQAIGKDAGCEARSLERCFLLVELCAELARVRPCKERGSLPVARVRASLLEIINEIRSDISFEALAREPALAAYAKAVFEKVVT